MKKLICTVITILLVLSLVACSQSTDANLNSLEKVKKDGKITIATSPDFPPFENIDGNGEIYGIEIDIFKEIANQLGVELEIVSMDFDSIIPGLKAGKYDAGVAGISVDEDRKKNALFTDAYCAAAQSIVIVEGSEVSSKSDLEGKKISLQTGTTAEIFCTEQGYNVFSFTNNNDAQSALVSGKVDAWVIDDLTAAEMVKEYNSSNPEKKLIVLDEAMTTEPYAFAFNLDCEELVNEINKIIDNMVENGKIKEIFDKYEAPYTVPQN